MFLMYTGFSIRLGRKLHPFHFLIDKREDFSVEISIKDSDWSINQSFFPLIILFLHSWQPEHKLTMHNGNLGGKYWPLPTGCPRELAIFFPYPIDIKSEK